MARSPIKTKIVATTGPATRSPQVIEALIAAGVDVFRINFSHGTLDGHAEMVRLVREAAAARQATVAILGDLCGPKIRTGAILGDERELRPGDAVEIVRQPLDGTVGCFGTNLPDLVHQARAGDRLLIDDGQIGLRVVESSPERLLCACEIGGVLGDHKGINLPDTALDTPPLTDKDVADLDWAVQHDLDYIALSFVRRAADVSALRDLVRQRRADVPIVTKIETPQAVADIDAIIAASDAVLVARGDLGVQIDLAAVPLIQKDIVARCRIAAKPVIVATQMLQSMVSSPTPTRAEVSDVANAILDGADAVMLSAETAIGQFPVEVIRVIERIAAETERFRAPGPMASSPPPGPRASSPHLGAPTSSPHPFQRSPTSPPPTSVQLPDSALSAESTLRDAIAAGAAWLADYSAPAAAFVWTLTGNTARRISKQRIAVPLIGLAPDDRIARRLALYYGVVPLVMRRPRSDPEFIAGIERVALETGWVEPGDLFLLIAGSSAKRSACPGPSAATSHTSHAIFLHRVGA